VEEPQHAEAVLPREPGSREHCVVVLVLWQWRQHFVDVRLESHICIWAAGCRYMWRRP
jgi:hypothetical protein